MIDAGVLDSEEAVEKAELVQDFHGRGVDGVAAPMMQTLADIRCLQR